MIAFLRDSGCTRCALHATTKRVCVGWRGDLRNDVMVIGEAPGANEERTGEPFRGEAGKLLQDELDEHGLSPFIHNAVNCRPPGNKKPSKQIVKACSFWVQERMRAVQPKFVLLLGNSALLSIAGHEGIKAHRGQPFEQDGVIYLPTYHPAYVLREPKIEGQWRADIKLFAKIVRLGEIPRERGLKYTIVDTREKFEDMLDDLRGTVAWDTETTGLYPWARELSQDITETQRELLRMAYGEDINRIVSIGFATRTQQWCLPVDHRQSPWRDQPERMRKMLERVTERLKDCVLVTHNGKFDRLWMRVRYGVDWGNDFDVMLAHWLVDENSLHYLDTLSQLYYGAPAYDVPLEMKWGVRGTLQEHCEYLAKDVFYTRKLRFDVGKQLDDDPAIRRVFDLLTMPCSDMYTEIEYNGVYINESRMADVERHLRRQVAEAELELQQYGNINWGSTKQLAKLLFEDLKLTPLDKTKSGKGYSTSESVLLRLEHPLTTALLKWRGAKKNLASFIDGWRPYIDENGYLHPSFKLHGTVTGRPSCEHPNLQQTPRDAMIRALITAPDGWVLLEIDESQAELRIAAELSGDPTLLAIFDRGEDAHWTTALREIERAAGMVDEVIDTASKWLLNREGRKVTKLSYSEAMRAMYTMGPDAAISINKIWKDIRKKAKAVNFGYLFGMWWKKFKIYARDNYGLIVTDKQAQESRESFFALYNRLPAWHNRQRRWARRNGYVRSLTGAKRRLPAAMLNYDCQERGEAERQAINSPVQRFACELQLMTTLQLWREFPEDIRICGTIHDATLIRVRENAVAVVVQRALEIMQNPEMLDDFQIKLRVPICGDAKLGPWGEGINPDQWLNSQSAKARCQRGASAGADSTTNTWRS
jgi:uracil-DNA glycosylase family 4